MRPTCVVISLLLLLSLACWAQPVYSTPVEIRELKFSDLKVVSGLEPATKERLPGDFPFEKLAPDNTLWTVTLDLKLGNDRSSEQYSLGPEEGPIFIYDMALGKQNILIDLEHGSGATRDGQIFLKQYMTPPGDGGYRIEVLESGKVLVRASTPTSNLILDSLKRQYLFGHEGERSQYLDLVNRDTNEVSRIQFPSGTLLKAQITAQNRLRLMLDQGKTLEVQLPRNR